MKIYKILGTGFNMVLETVSIILWMVYKISVLCLLSVFVDMIRVEVAEVLYYAQLLVVYSTVI